VTITTAQMRGARGLLNWSQSELSKRTGISTTSIGNIEAGNTQPREATMKLIRQAFENSGIEFIGTEGMRIKNDNIYSIEGSDALDRLLDDIYSTLASKGGEVLGFGVEEKTELTSEEHKKISSYLTKLKNANITERLIIREGDVNLMAPAEFYKSIPEEYFSPHPFYIYGDKIALINWGNQTKIFIINSPLFSETFKRAFNFMWNNAHDLNLQIKRSA
jgi:transcriptional regulator with XRE-family HTH domain